MKRLRPLSLFEIMFHISKQHYEITCTGSSEDSSHFGDSKTERRWYPKF